MGSNTLADYKRKKPTYTLLSHSEGETSHLAKSLVRCLKPGDWLCLVGEIGSGKTMFVRALAEAFHCQPPYSSPSFTLVQTYKPRPRQGRMPLHHVDLYRLKGQEVGSLEWEDLLHSPGVTVMEWADKAQIFWPDRCIPIHLDVVDESKRQFNFFSAGDRASEVIKKLRGKKRS